VGCRVQNRGNLFIQCDLDLPQQACAQGSPKVGCRVQKVGCRVQKVGCRVQKSGVPSTRIEQVIQVSFHANGKSFSLWKSRETQKRQKPAWQNGEKYFCSKIMSFLKDKTARAACFEMLSRKVPAQCRPAFPCPHVEIIPSKRGLLGRGNGRGGEKDSSSIKSRGWNSLCWPAEAPTSASWVSS